MSDIGTAIATATSGVLPRRRPEVLNFLTWAARHMVVGKGRWAGLHLMITLALAALGVGFGGIWTIAAIVAGIVLLVNLLLNYERRRSDTSARARGDAIDAIVTELRAGLDRLGSAHDEVAERTSGLGDSQALLLAEEVDRLRGEQTAGIARANADILARTDAALEQLSTRLARRIADAGAELDERREADATALRSEISGDVDRRLAAAIDRARGEFGEQVRAAFDMMSEVVYNVEMALAARVDQTAAALDKAARVADLSQSAVESVREDVRGLEQRLAAQFQRLDQTAELQAVRDATREIQDRLSFELVRIEAAAGATASELQDLRALAGETNSAAAFLAGETGRLESRIEALQVEAVAIRAFAGTSAREPVERLEREIHDVQTLLDQRHADAAEALARQRTELGERVEAIGADAAAGQEAVGEIRERLETIAIDVATGRDAVGQLGERIEAVAAESGAAREAAEARAVDEIETRLDDWRRRLDNEIKSAIAAGREADQRHLQDIEGSLRSAIKALASDAAKVREEVAEAGRAAHARLEETLAAEMAAAREAVGARIGDAMAAVTDVGQQRLGEVEAALREEFVHLTELTGAEQRRVAALAEAVQAEIASEIGAVERQLAAASDEIERHIEQRLAAFDGARSQALVSVQETIAVTEDRIAAGEARAKDMQAAIEARLAALTDTIEASKEELEAAAATAASAAAEAVASRAAHSATDNMGVLRKMSGSNASVARPFDRMLTSDKLDRFQKHWIPVFGLNMSRSALAYLAHQICLLEDRGAGRIAAPIETIVLRQLALRSLRRKELEVMEIGTLFGLGAAALHHLRGRSAPPPKLTIIDPLEGYYDAGVADPTTGIEVSEATLRENFTAVGLPDSDWRLIKASSTAPEAIKQASDRLYDFILVDGDHSTAGVAADWANYASLVRPGGMMLFDDYGSEHWPGIQPLIDEQVRTDPEWTWIGGEYRTAIVTKRHMVS